MPDIADIKIAVLQCALGISSLPERELYERLERFWADAFALGCKETGFAMLAHLERQGLIDKAAVQKVSDSIAGLRVAVQPTEPRNAD